MPARRLRAPTASDVRAPGTSCARPGPLRVIAWDPDRPAVTQLHVLGDLVVLFGAALVGSAAHIAAARDLPEAGPEA